MNGMKHSKTMKQRRKDNMTGPPSGGGIQKMGGHSHRNYKKDARSGGPFGK